MAMNINASNPINAYQKLADLSPANPNNKSALGQTTADQASAKGVAQKTEAQVTQMTIRNERQASLVAHLFGDPATAPSDALKMTFQAAMDKINEILQAELPQSDVDTPPPISEAALKAQGGMDYWTPENTAKRIVDGTTAFLSGYQQAHPELQGEALINGFLDVIGGGIKDGFDSAKDILGGLDVLKGDIASNIEKTYTLVQEGLTKFKNDFLGAQAENPIATATANPSVVWW